MTTSSMSSTAHHRRAEASLISQNGLTDRMLLQVDDRSPDSASPTDALALALTSALQGETPSGRIVELMREAVLFVPQHPEAPTLSDEDIARGRFSIGVHQVGGRNVASVFSSEAALARFVAPGSTYVAIPGEALLKMWSPDDWLLLNPGSRYRLLLGPSEVTKIMAGEPPTSLEIQPVGAGPDT